MRKIQGKYHDKPVAFHEHPFMWMDAWIAEADENRREAKAVSRFVLCFFTAWALLMVIFFVVVSLIAWQPMVTLVFVAVAAYRWLRWTVGSS